VDAWLLCALIERNPTPVRHPQSPSQLALRCGKCCLLTLLPAMSLSAAAHLPAAGVCTLHGVSRAPRV
jgi:hypothetical protein